MQKYIIKNEEAAVELTEQIIKTLKSGQTIGITGQLGAGKTFLVKKLALTLGIKETIKSPSFNLMKIYNIKKTIKQENNKTKRLRKSPPDKGRASPEAMPAARGWGVTPHNLNTLVHIDCYRLNNPAELIDIGLFEYLQHPGTLTIIEWADKVKKILPKDTIWINLKINKDHSRTVRIS